MPTIIVYWSPGRSDQQKFKVVQSITKSMVEDAGAKREDVLIIFQNIEPGNAARAGILLGINQQAENSQPDSSP